MLLTLQEDRRAGSSDAVLKTISSRIAGGQRTVSTEPSKVQFIITAQALLLNIFVIRSLSTLANLDLRFRR